MRPWKLPVWFTGQESHWQHRAVGGLPTPTTLAWTAPSHELIDGLVVKTAEISYTAFAEGMLD